MSAAHPERSSRAQIRDCQDQRLRELIAVVAKSNPFWQRKFREAGIEAGSIRGVDDLARLPFTTKQEIVDDQAASPPYGSNLTFPLSRYGRLHQTSGTTGRPMRFLDTPESWDWFMHCWGQIYRLVGLREEDVVGFPFSFGPFIGFWAAFDGAVSLGRRVIPMGGLTSEGRLHMILELGATFLCCTPTYALRMADVARGMGLDLASSAVRGILVAGEPGGNIPAVRQRIESAWGARVFDHWGMTDVGSLGIEPEAAPHGLSLLETECIAEILDPKTNEPVAPGELGELVVTNLGRVGQPAIRYRTGDLVREATGPCPSGLALRRLEGGILGRVDDMVAIRGNNVFPSSIEAILREFPEVAEYRIVVQTIRSMPHLRIEVEPVTAERQLQEIDSLLAGIRREIKDRLNFLAEIVPAETGSLPRFELKGRRFVRE